MIDKMRSLVRQVCAEFESLPGGSKTSYTCRLMHLCKSQDMVIRYYILFLHIKIQFTQYRSVENYKHCLFNTYIYQSTLTVICMPWCNSMIMVYFVLISEVLFYQA